MSDDEWPGPAKYRIFGWAVGFTIIALCVYLVVL
tara:strand:- start:320 stop:421 length:102 start_codon:yes stop_codon:yes gene_type:complete